MCYRIVAICFIQNRRSFITKITIKPEYERLVPGVTVQEFDKLKEDISQNGLHYPIIINGDGIVLDGHHRFKACQELGIDCSYTTKHFKDDLDEKEFVILINLRRRHLTVPQKTILIIEIEKIESDRIKRAESLRKKGGLLPIGNSPKKKPDLAANIALEKSGNILTERTYRRSKAVLQSDEDDVIQQFLDNKISAGKAESTIKHRKRRKTAVKEALNHKPEKSEKYEILFGDILEAGKDIADNSVDLIFTDPPYGKDTLDVYSKLGELAVRVLKPGASLVTIVPHHFIPEVHKMLIDARYWDEEKASSPILKYHWLVVLRHGGHARRVHAYDVWAHYKPILWYYKPMVGKEKPITYHDVNDLVESKPVDKTLHEWEQAIDEAKNMIHSLTVEGHIVLDPFTGSGTTLEAAIRMKRYALGIENDKTTKAIAEKRLSPL